MNKLYPTEEYNEDNIMHFGKYRGQRLGDIPASYLIWWWNETGRKRTKLRTEDGFLSRWIKKQLRDLELEEPNKIILKEE